MNVHIFSFCLTLNTSRTNFCDLKRDETIIDVDLAAHLHHLSDVLVIQPKDILIAVLHVGIIQCHLDLVTPLQLHLSSATLS